MRLGLLVCVGLAMWLAANAAQAETVWLIQKPSKCVTQKLNAQQSGVDFVLRKCMAKDFPPLWLAFIDSSRSGIGFGSLPNLASTAGNLKQTNGPIEWGGQMRDGKFKAQVAIIRRSYDDYNFEPPKKVQSLAIFRMLNNGSSCLVGDVRSSADQAAIARVVANTKINDFSCESSAELLDIKQ